MKMSKRSIRREREKRYLERMKGGAEVIDKRTLIGIKKGKYYNEDSMKVVEGLKAENWRELRWKPLVGDVTERYDNPMTLQKSFSDYMLWASKHPFKRNEVIKTGVRAGQVVEYETRRPLSLQMFLGFIGMPKSVWYNKRKKEGFVELCEMIEDVIGANQIDGALAGVYDSSLVSKLNKIGEEIHIVKENALNVNLSIEGKVLGDVIEIEDIGYIEERKEIGDVSDE